MKYLEISKIYIKSQLVWRADVVFQVLFTVTKILFAYLLWGIIFHDRTEVAGFSFQSMLSYYVISSLLSQIEMSDGISSEISQRIRNGTFSKYMVIPVDIQKYFIAMEAGVVAYYGIFQFMAAFVWVIIFRIQFVVSHNPIIILCAFLLVVLGLLFMVQLNYYLGLLALKYQEIGTFLMIKNNLVAFITGSIVPLMLLPEGIVSVMKFFPFYYITYLPSMLFIGQLESEAVPGLVIIFIWCVMLQVLIHVTWGSDRRKYDGVGI